MSNKRRCAGTAFNVEHRSGDGAWMFYVSCNSLGGARMIRNSLLRNHRGDAGYRARIVMETTERRVVR